MFIKKSTIEKPAKKRDNKKIKTTPSNAEREAIRKLIDDIPAMIKREGYLPEKPVGREMDNIEKIDPRVVIHQKKLWLWIGVGIFTALIFVIWALNVKTMIYDIRGSTSEGEALLKNGRDEFKNVFNAIKKNDADLQKKLQAEDANKGIEQTLKEILLTIFTPSSTVTATLKSKL